MSDNKQDLELQRSKYRKGCLTGLLVAVAIIIISSGISQVTSYKTNIQKSVDFLYEYNMSYPKEATENNILIHVSNNNFITVKTSLSDTGEGKAKANLIKDQIISILTKQNKKACGLKITSKNNKTLYDSTTKGFD